MAVAPAVSILQLKVAGLGSALPALSIARTSKRVGALGQFGVLLRGGAGRPGAAVAAALEGGDAGAGAVAAAEGEVGRGAVGERRRVGVDLGLGGA